VSTLEPSVKGIVFLSAVDRLRELMDKGEVQREDVTRVLEPDDLACLETRVMPTLWYPVGVGGRYVEALWELEGGRRTEYLRQRGATAAGRIFEAGIYANVMKTAEDWGGAQLGHTLIGFAAQFYNFMRWELVGCIHSAEYEIDVRDATAWPDVLRLASEGFIEVLHSRASKRPLAVASQRPSPDRVVFRIATSR
jgi:hypothetical protein